MKIIKYGGQNISQSDIDEVKKSLKNDLITTGPYVKKFEDKLRNFVECKYALTTSSGTSAIHLSLLSLQLKKNATIIMPAVNFISSYSMSKNLGLKVYLADVDPVTGQMTPKNVLDCVKKNSIKKLIHNLSTTRRAYRPEIIRPQDLKQNVLPNLSTKILD